MIEESKNKRHPVRDPGSVSSIEETVSRTKNSRGRNFFRSSRKKTDEHRYRLTRLTFIVVTVTVGGPSFGGVWTYE